MDILDLITRMKLPFRKDRELYRSLHKILGFYPRNIRPYKVALLHRSAGVREEGKRIDNERLEFLGDAILDAVVGHIVYRHFPKKSEGFLTNARSNIVKRQSLGELAKETGFDRLIISNYKRQGHNNYTAGNAFEALIGAIYLDRGYGHCVRFVREKIMKQLVDIEKAANEVNYKSRLIEWGQKKHIEIEFEAEESKENNATPVFLSRVLIGGTVCGTGRGYSKKESQQMASKEAFERVRQDREFVIGLTAPKDLQKEIIEPPQPLTQEEKAEQHEDAVDIDFSDITMKERSREDIIAEAEAQAFAE